MTNILKPLAVAGIAGTLALGMMTSADAQSRAWRNAGIGLAAGAVVGAAVAGAAQRHYYGPYGYDRGPYAYGGYYEPAPVYGYYDDGYAAYGAAPVYEAPVYEAPRVYRYGRGYRGGLGTGSYQNDLHGAGNT